ncbi:hypothetical protein JXQ70_02205 [bacterium]|nr:hypothetical protein [bacterium]
MKKVLLAVFVILIMASAAFCFFFHLVRTRDGMQVFVKEKPGFAHTYLDSRSWGPLDYLKYPHIAHSMMSDTLGEISQSFQKSVRDFQAKADQAAQTISQHLENSEKARNEMSELKQEFEKEWQRLQEKIKKTADSKKLKKLEQDTEKLVQWFQKEIKKIEEKYSSN